MLLIWRGWGLVVVGIALVAFFGAGIVGRALDGNDRWTVALAGAFLAPAGIATWDLGKRTNRDTVRELVDPRTAQTVLIRNDHSLFFVRVEWWGPIMVVLGIILLAAGIVSPGISR